MITGTWLAATGLWRRGLPGRNVLLLDIAMLLAAMAGGLHLIDPGPMWRLLCGLYTGHVILLWLVVGSTHLWFRFRSPARIPVPWRRRDRIAALALPIMLTLLAAIFPALQRLGWYTWAVVTLIGAAALLAAVSFTAVAVSSALVCPILGKQQTRG